MKATIEVEKTVNQIHNTAKELNSSVTLTKATPSEIRDLMRKAGTKIASVHFIKRSDNKLRKMCYRLGVTNPKHSTSPKGKSKRKEINLKNKQMTVYDVNKVIRNKDGETTRGAYRTVPLENVKRVCVDGVTYQITK